MFGVRTEDHYILNSINFKDVISEIYEKLANGNIIYLKFSHNELNILATYEILCIGDQAIEDEHIGISNDEYMWSLESNSVFLEIFISKKTKE